jgi:plastocyanin
MRPMRASLALMPILLALALAACGGGDNGGGGGGASSKACPSGAVVITMKDIQFDPKEATAGVGQQICWRNEDGVDHDAVAEKGATFKSDLFGKGETFTTTADKPGRIEYVCTIHPGMTGTIEVTR